MQIIMPVINQATLDQLRLNGQKALIHAKWQNANAIRDEHKKRQEADHDYKGINLAKVKYGKSLHAHTKAKDTLASTKAVVDVIKSMMMEENDAKMLTAVSTLPAHDPHSFTPGVSPDMTISSHPMPPHTHVSLSTIEDCVEIDEFATMPVINLEEVYDVHKDSKRKSPPDCASVGKLPSVDKLPSVGKLPANPYKMAKILGPVKDTASIENTSKFDEAVEQVAKEMTYDDIDIKKEDESE